jgi:hypothetical protein
MKKKTIEIENISYKEYYSLKICEEKQRNNTFHIYQAIFYIDKQYSYKLHSQNKTSAVYNISHWDSL